MYMYMYICTHDHYHSHNALYYIHIIITYVLDVPGRRRGELDSRQFVIVSSLVY